MTKEVNVNFVYDNPNNLVDLFEQSVTKHPELHSSLYRWLRCSSSNA